MKAFINSLFSLALCAGVLACAQPAQPTIPAPAAPSATTTQEATTPPLPPAKAESATPTSAPAVKEKQLPLVPPTVQEAKKQIISHKAYVPSPEEKIKAFKKWDENLQSLRIQFTQTTSYDGVLISQSQGVLSYHKGKNLLRLDTLDEAGKITQTALTDKKQIFVLDEAGHTVTQLSWAEWQQSQPNQALFDFGNYTALLERHNIQVLPNNTLVLTPKQGENYTLHLSLSAQDYFPYLIKIVAEDVVTEARLQHTQKNTPLDLSIFGGFFK